MTRLRWAVRAVLTLGVAASVAANVLHARPNLISQIIAAWPPLALLLTVELISRVPADRRGLAAVRLIAAGVIAGIAAWVSYWHMVGVAARYGETSAAASYLLPISVDGLVVVASISLVEIAGRIRAPSVSPAEGEHSATVPAEMPFETAEPQSLKAPAPASGTPPAAQMAQGLDVPPTDMPEAEIRRDESAPPIADTSGHKPTGAIDHEDAHLARTGDDAAAPPHAPPLRGTEPSHHATEGSGTSRSRTTGSPGTPVEKANEQNRAHPPGAAHRIELEPCEGQGCGPVPEGGRSSAEVPPGTAGAVAYWYRRDPSLHPAEIATRIGRSERTVRRYWPPVPRTANEHDTSRSAK
ncbi:DUF2637 domain-containing protein [Micromonospora sp. NPDC007220]|uniref:DUF2637 domain-containing protein n=1 Tax=Micromonospora sp. NPDC007220 TaxID=3154318 RepID=UPI0033CF599E